MRLRTRLPAVAASAQSARALLRERFSEQLPADAMCDLLTVVSELVTNAIRYGDDGRIGLAVAVGRNRIHGEVQNSGRGRIEQKRPDPSRSGGLGLHIVDAIADTSEVRANGLTRVSFDLAY